MDDSRSSLNTFYHSNTGVHDKVYPTVHASMWPNKKLELICELPFEVREVYF